MGTAGVTATDDYSYTKTERVPKKELDQTDFLTLLATQMQCQDPLNPQSNDEFIATMAQFNSLTAMTSIDSTTQYSKAMEMVGKTVIVQEDNADPVTGIVEKVGTDEDGKVHVYVEGNPYSISDVVQVEAGNDTSQISANSWDLMQAALLIGKEVIFDDDSGGVVEKVSMADGSIKVYVNGTPHDMGGITQIGGTGESDQSDSESEAEQNESEQQ